jgi:hypothetical protein
MMQAHERSSILWSSMLSVLSAYIHSVAVPMRGIVPVGGVLQK